MTIPIAICARPIDERAYAPYGALVRAGPDAAARIANHGMALAWDALATLENLRGGAARATASLFRCLAITDARLAIRWLERHPESTQMFVPLRASRYLVIVARGLQEPDPATLAAFVVPARAAITYAPGTWHHPMVALDEDAEFVNVLFVDGTARDCDERSFDPPCAEVLVPSDGP